MGLIVTGRGLDEECLRQRDLHEKQPELQKYRGNSGGHGAPALRGDPGAEGGRAVWGKLTDNEGHRSSTSHARAWKGHQDPMILSPVVQMRLGLGRVLIAQGHRADKCQAKDQSPTAQNDRLCSGLCQLPGKHCRLLGGRLESQDLYFREISYRSRIVIIEVRN